MQHLPNSVSSWIAAIRPKTLAAAITPVLVGGSLAYRDCGGEIGWLPFALCVLFALMMQIDANLINDYIDYRKGSDGEERLGPKRACASGWITPQAMRWGIIIVTALACLAGMPLIFYGGWSMIIVGMVCVVFAFLYSTLLSYRGWGDLLVIIFFGIVPVGFTYFIQRHCFTVDLLLLSLACGVVTDTLLIVNNYRDRREDRLHGKRTIIVMAIERLGESKGARLSRLFFLFQGIVGVLLSIHPLSNFYGLSFLLLYLTAHILTFSELQQTKDGTCLNKVLAHCSLCIISFGVFVSLSLLLSF